MYVHGTENINNNPKPDVKQYVTNCFGFMNSIYGNGYASNPLKGNKLKDFDNIIENLANIKNPELRKELENIILNGAEPSKDFVDVLIERFEKKQAEFEEAWARYQEAKGDRMTYKEMLEKLQKKYADSESGYEQGLITKAENKFKDADINSDILLSIASYLAHRVI